MRSSWHAVWQSRSSIVGRLLTAFGAHLVLFALAAFVVWRALGQLDAADAELTAIERPRAAVDRIAALIREQYIHQAHTIIESDRSHLDHYGDIARLTRSTVASLRPMLPSEVDQRSLGTIAELVRRNDEEFLALTVPAVDAGNVARARELHRDMEAIVIAALRENRLLADRLDDRGHVARLRADALRDRVRWSVLVCFVLSAAIAMSSACARPAGFRAASPRSASGHATSAAARPTPVSLWRGATSLPTSRAASRTWRATWHARTPR